MLNCNNIKRGGKRMNKKLMLTIVLVSLIGATVIPCYAGALRESSIL